MSKQLLTENIKIKSSMLKPISIPLNENNLLHEGRKYKYLAAYTFPVSTPDRENYNQRIYSTKLWETVIQKKMGEGSYGLIGHPEDDGSPANAFCVWKNVRFNKDKNLVLADAYLFGARGQQALAALDAGGEIGLSTVGYGDFKKDGKTIEESTYELSRVADWVLDPSVGVFGDLNDAILQENKRRKKLQESSQSIKPGQRIIVEKEFRLPLNEKEDLIIEKGDVIKLLISKTLREKFRQRIQEKVRKMRENKKLSSEKENQLKKDFQKRVTERIAARRDKLGEKVEILGRKIDKLEEGVTKLTEKPKKEEYKPYKIAVRGSNSDFKTAGD